MITSKYEKEVIYLNKIIIAAIALLLLVGGFVLLKGAFRKNMASNNPTQTQTTTTTNPKTQEKSVTIKLDKTGFNPASVDVGVGTRVVFINESGEMATVNSDDHPIHTKFPFLNLGEFGNGSSVQAVFDKAGTFTYHNHLNPSQKGTIVVK